MMPNDHDKIQALIDSGTTENIELAFALMHSTGVEVLLPTKADMEDWLRRQEDYNPMVEFSYNTDWSKCANILPRQRQKEAIFLLRADVSAIIDLGEDNNLPNFVRWQKELQSLVLKTVYYKVSNVETVIIKLK